MLPRQPQSIDGLKILSNLGKTQQLEPLKININNKTKKPKSKIKSFSFRNTRRVCVVSRTIYSNANPLLPPQSEPQFENILILYTEESIPASHGNISKRRATSFTVGGCSLTVPASCLYCLPSCKPSRARQSHASPIIRDRE